MTEKKIEISLTDFIDFVNKSGSQKLTQVRKVKNRPEYEAFADFYKPLREKIQTIHKKGLSKDELDKVLDSLTDDKKKTNYPGLIEGYKKFWGRRKMRWFQPPYRNWKIGDLEIRINPELGLEYNGQFYVVKLFFKDEKIQRSQFDQILTLMEYQLRSKVNEPEIQFAILDIRKAKLYPQKGNSTELIPLLLGEAKSFIEIWKGID